MRHVTSVAYQGCGRHGTCHGHQFDGGRKIAWQQLKFVTYSFFNLHFVPHTIINCQAASTHRPYSNALSRACCASSTKQYDKTALLWHNTTVKHCNRTRTPACHIKKTSSFSRYKKGSVTPCYWVSGKRILVRIRLKWV